MRFAVLGPLRVFRDDVEVTPSAPKQRQLLAVLLSGSGPVPVERLIEEIWGRCPPESCRDQLRWHAHQLRNRLGDSDLLVRGDGGYRLDTNALEVDSRRFDELLREAAQQDDATQRGRLLEAALSLWRGEAYAGLADVGAVRAEAMRLETARLAATEQRVDIDLRLGRHRERVAELEHLVASFPSRQRFRAQLMTALHRSGRRAEALETYRAAPPVTTSPGDADAELRRVHKAILADDAEASFDHRRELVALTRLLRDGAASVVSITGAAGVGKSALANRAARETADRFRDGRLYARLRGTDPGSPPLAPAAVLRELLLCLGVATEDAMDTDELSARFRSATNGKRLLIVLDDARDTAQVRPLLPGSPTCAVIITSRQRLTTIAGAAHVPLEPGGANAGTTAPQRSRPTMVSGSPATG